MTGIITMPDASDVLDANEAAQYLKINVQTIRRLEPPVPLS